MDKELLLIVSHRTWIGIKSGKSVEVATQSELAPVVKMAVVRGFLESDTMIVNVKFSHTEFGRHFIFLSLTSTPMQISLAEEVGPKTIFNELKNMTQEQQKTFEQAIKTYGITSQLDMAIEEAAEMIQAINKAKRAGIVHKWGISKPSLSCTDEQVEAYNNLCSEVADLKNMIAQLEIMLDQDKIQLYTILKIERLQLILDKTPSKK